MIYKQGQWLILEQGEYSDFGYDGPFRVLRDIDVQTVVADFIAAEEKPYANPSAFIAWLARQGFIEDVDCAKWYLGDAYGSFRPEGFTRPRPPEAQPKPPPIVKDKTKVNRKPTFSGPGYLDPV